MTAPLVSIITITRGRDSVLPAAWHCVKAQTYPNIEWLILDDSPEPTKALDIRCDPRIRYWHRPSPTPLSTGYKQNELCKVSSGEFIAIFDDDDYYAPNFLSTMIAFLQDRAADMVKLSAWFIYVAYLDRLAYWDLRIGQGLHFGFQSGAVQPIMIDQSQAEFARKNLFGWGFNCCFKKSVWEEFQFRDVNVVHDYEFVASALSKNKLEQFADTTGLCLHILHGGNLSTCFPQFLLPRFMLKSFFPGLGGYYSTFAEGKFFADNRIE